MDRTLWSIYPKERKIYNSLTEAVPIGWRIVARLRQQTIARDVTHSNRAVVRGCNDVTAGGRWRKRLASGDFGALLCAWLWGAGLCAVSSGSGVVERKCCHVGSIDLADVTDVNTDVTTASAAIHIDWARIEVSTENNTISKIQGNLSQEKLLIAKYFWQKWQTKFKLYALKFAEIFWAFKR